MRIPYYIGVIFLLTISSCNKDKNNQGHNPCSGEPDTTFIKSTDLKNCRYKTGSYWIFIDSVNNAIDSLSIISFNEGFVDDECGNSYEIHSFKTISSYSSELTDYVVVAGGLFKDFDGTPNSGIQIYDDFDVTTAMTNYQTEKFDSLLIYDEYYKRVLRVEIENDQTENNNKSIYFINSEYGFLRHDLYSNNILTSKKILMRKNIER